jgi:hypothetical protein
MKKSTLYRREPVMLVTAGSTGVNGVAHQVMEGVGHHGAGTSTHVIVHAIIVILSAIIARLSVYAPATVEGE